MEEGHVAAADNSCVEKLASDGCKQVTFRFK